MQLHFEVQGQKPEQEGFESLVQELLEVAEYLLGCPRDLLIQEAREEARAELLA